MEGVNNALVFLVDILHGFLIIIFTARLLFELVNVSIQNPISLFVLRFTENIIKPIQVLIPTIRGVNLATVLVLIVLNIAKIYLLILLGHSIPVSFINALVFSCIQLVPSQILNFFFWSIIISVVFSWLANAKYHPLAQVTNVVSSFVLSPIQRLLPNTTGIDFSPVVALIIIGVLQRLLQF